MKSVEKLFKLFMLATIRFYKLTLAPFLGNRCRFYPSCSAYAQECIHTQNIFKAMILILKRILKCHPFHPGGIDLPPEKK
jgi:putative membrane protein insertion efficiency factor